MTGGAFIAPAETSRTDHHAPVSPLEAEGSRRRAGGGGRPLHRAGGPHTLRLEGKRMPNGKGSLDCYYCIHYGGTTMGERAECSFHRVVLKKTAYERICCHFEAHQRYWDDNSIFSPPARKFSWLGADLEPGILYEYGYNDPRTIVRTTAMRIPDYQKNEWTRAEDAT